MTMRRCITVAVGLSVAAAPGCARPPQPAPVTTDAAPAVARPAASTLAPIVTSLGKVGGGGYSTGTLDAQRENNKLTSETNRILREIGERMKPGMSQSAAAFG